MARTTSITKEYVYEQCLKFIEENGIEEMNARNLAKYMNCSTQPIYQNFISMNALKEELIQQINELYFRYIDSYNHSIKYKSYGLGYISFAKEHKEYFKILFMSPLSKYANHEEQLQKVYEAMMKNTDISLEQAKKIHEQLWIHVHGIATLIATSVLPYDEQKISTLVSEEYFSIFDYYKKEVKKDDCSK